ncbi:hypothetical protein DDB_G0277633 [Dictyostelium discoideum AX4]|uniref:Uncharacterized protein n=1 Tax=Dictyostelium discoideum TaxID=44689 RepID=Q54ZC8_DICDI|nr:hypothetical protein DDB_G0277633 [Dictyostelium discoideum AX4]EAL68634.1 hypothetical protein DDB_G0277633 [Dictyostelium discoideum AX4]|eukprot:XP_642569.1 hypothetical protein DDB_G0277633 [Dictyostelium discoideum AX4]
MSVNMIHLKMKFVVPKSYDSRCKDIKCQPGFECKYDPVKDEMCCVPINNCDDVRCPPDFECE